MSEFSPEKRLLIAFALSIVIFLGWGAYMRWKYPAPPPVIEEPQRAPTSEAPSVVPPSPAQSEPAGPPLAMPEGGLQPKAAEAETEYRVELRDATVLFSNRGAVVRSWTLKNYHDAAGKPLELAQARTTRLGWPLSFQLGDAKLEEKLNDALYAVTATEASGDQLAEVTFEWSDGQVAARKHFRFTPDGLCEIRTAIFAPDNPVPHRVAWRGGFGEHAVAASGTTVLPQVFVRKPDGLHRQLATQAGQTTGWLWKSASPFPYSGEAAYAGIEDQYFAALFIPQRPELSASAWVADWTPAPGEDGKAKAAVKIGAVAVGGDANGNALRLFVGPKDIEVLERLAAPTPPSGGVQPRLGDELVDYGWFSLIAKPLLWAMQWLFRNAVPNYGWVIILLTVFINFALFPLKLKSMESAWKMQKLAPQMKAIQERYKQYKFNDPRKQQQQQEIMALYQQHGVNPIGGCLPLLLQIPFFFGFYKVLAISIELRQAPWFGWIHDLSQHDPYYILPIVMTATMYLSTRMTPMTTADPMQQKMMQLMPLIFGFMFLSFSSGLVLYWMASNIVGIGQQWWINRRHRLHDAAEKLTARDRKKKKKRPEDAGGESEE